MKISHKLCVRMDGTQFLLLWWFTAKNEGGNHIIAWVYGMFLFYKLKNMCKYVANDGHKHLTFSSVSSYLGKENRNISHLLVSIDFLYVGAAVYLFVQRVWCFDQFLGTKWVFQLF